MLEALTHWWLDQVMPLGSVRVRITDGVYVVEVKKKVSVPDICRDRQVNNWVSADSFTSQAEAEEYIGKLPPAPKPRQPRSKSRFLYY